MVSTHSDSLLMPLATPLSLSRTGDTHSATKRFKRLFAECAYCGDDYKAKTLHEQPVILTYEHIDPKSSGAIAKSLGNGLLACSPCNSSRGNKPLLKYLLGLGKLPLDVSGTTPEHRQKSFARYLRFYVENRVKLQPTDKPSSWFSEALNHLISPIQSSLATPLERGKELFGFLATLDPFWKGETFSRIVEQDFTREPQKQDLLRQIVRSLQPVVKFAGSKIARMTRLAESA